MSLSSEEVAFGQDESTSVFGARQAAGIVAGCGTNWTNCQLYWFWPVLRIWIERMLAGIENREHIHLGTEVNVIAGLGVARDKAHAAIGVDVDAAEEIHVG